jgi:hypothetical protein
MGHDGVISLSKHEMNRIGFAIHGKIGSTQLMHRFTADLAPPIMKCGCLNQVFLSSRDVR